MAVGRCRIDRCCLEIGTDGNGCTVAVCKACERRRAHRCMDCGQPVQGRSWRCETHKRAAKLCDQQRFETRNREERNAADRRRYWKTPGLRERRCREKKDWRRNNPLKVALEKRRGRLDGTWGYRDREAYLEAMRKQNAKPERRKKCREWARDNQSVYFKNGKKLYPRCARCGGIVAWNRRGRPMKYHPQCNPWTREGAAA